MTDRPRALFAQIPHWVALNESVSGSATVLRVYTALVIEADIKARITRATWTRLAQITGLGRSAIYRDVAVLRSIGAIRDRADGSAWLPLDPLDQSTAMDSQSAPVDDKSTPMDSTLLKERLEVKHPPSPQLLPDPFIEFWEAYPRHESKRAAEIAYAKARHRGASPEVMLAGAQRYRDDPNRDPSYTKMPATWLNKDCWSDDPLPARRRDVALPASVHLNLPAAWTEVQRAVRDRGFSQGPPEWSHPELARTVAAVSWRKLCHDTNGAALYAQFRDTYRTQFEEAANAR